MEYMWIFWLIAFLAFLVLEFVTVAMVSIWFAGGSLVALLMALAGVDVAYQIIVMLVVSLVLLAIFFVLRKRLGILPQQKQATNADRLIGKTGEVILTIDPVENIGQVQVNGQIWSARTDLPQSIATGTSVRIVELRGVKLVVVPSVEATSPAGS